MFNTCANGEHFDADLEGVNAVFQGTASGNSAQSWELAALFADCSVSITRQLYENLDLRQGHATGFHSTVDHCLDRSSAEIFFGIHRSAQHQVNGIFRGFTNKPLNDAAHDLFAQGRREIAAVAKTYRAGEDYVVKKAIPLSAKEAAHGVVNPVVGHTALWELKAQHGVQAESIAALEAQALRKEAAAPSAEEGAPAA